MKPALGWKSLGWRRSWAEGRDGSGWALVIRCCSQLPPVLYEVSFRYRLGWGRVARKHHFSFFLFFFFSVSDTNSLYYVWSKDLGWEIKFLVFCILKTGFNKVTCWVNSCLQLVSWRYLNHSLGYSLSAVISPVVCKLIYGSWKTDSCFCPRHAKKIRELIAPRNPRQVWDPVSGSC